MKNIAILLPDLVRMPRTSPDILLTVKTLMLRLFYQIIVMLACMGVVNKLGVPSFVFSREEFIAGVPILEKLAEYDVCLIVLAGFMNKISDVILQAFPGKIVNIHPALLPKYGGKGMYGMHVHEAVVKAGERESGITIHYINEHYDEGAIIFQASCPVLPSDTPEEVASKVHALEYAHYPHVIESLL